MGLQIVNRQFTDYQNRTLSFPFFQGWDTLVAKYTLEVDFSIQLSITNQMQVDGNTLSLTNGNWEELGFFAGASVTGTYQHATGGSHSIPSGATVLYVDGAVMTITYSSGTMYDGLAQIGLIRCDEKPNAFEVEFNLVANNGSSTNQFSLIDGEVNRFQVDASGLGVSDPTINFVRLGNFSGGSKMLARIDRIADVSGKKRYEISITFRNWTIKDLNLFLATNCVKPWVRFKVFPEYQNPTVFIDIINTPSDAQTGGFNEVGNGGIPDYTLDSIEWTNDNGDVLPTFDYTQPSNFLATINGNFTSGSKLNLAWYFDSLEDADYKNLPTAIDNNLMLLTSDVPLVVGANTDIDGFTRSNGAGLVLSDIEITQFSTYARVSGKFTPNTEFTSFIESKENFNRNFRFAIRVENPSLIDNFIRPVWIDADSQIMTKEIVPLGEYPDIVSYDLYGHDNSVNPSILFIEDDFQTVTTLTLPTENDFNSINLGLVALNTVTGERFIIESSSCMLDGFPQLIDGSKPIAKTINLPINLSPTNPNKKIIWERDESLDSADVYGVRLVYSSVVDWKYWIEQINANIAFFPNQNRDLLNYQSGDWVVAFAVQIDTPLGQYENGYLLELRDYDDWNGSTVVEYFKEDLTPITKPLNNEISIIKATHTSPTLFQNSAPKWGQMTIEPKEASPRWDISSAYDWSPSPSNPLMPLVGDERLYIEIDGNDMITMCRFDPSKLANNADVSITSRIYNDKDGDSELQNRHKVTIKSVKLPKDETPETRLPTDNCCDCIWDVFADAESTKSYKNHVSSRWVIAETVVFKLYKSGVLTSFQPTAQDFTNDLTAKYCTIPWRDVLLVDGQGCYVLKAELETAGLSFEKTLGTFNLMQFDWDLAKKKTMLRSVFNDANLREEINFTGSNVIDCIMFDGDVEEFQPNTDINNLVFSDYSQNKVKRENLTSWTVNVNPSGYCMINRLINLHLVGENELFVSDYRYDAFDKTILDKPCILSETPQMTALYSSERQKSTFKVQEKVVKNLTKYGSVEASAQASVDQLIYPNTVSEGGSVEAKVYNSDGDLIVTETVTSVDPNIDFPDTEIILKDSGGTTISTTSESSGVSHDLTAPDGQVVIKNSGLAIISTQNVKSGSSQNYIVANSVVLLQDSSSTMIDSFNVPATAGTTRTVADSVVTLKDSAGTTISTTNVKATESKNITAPDGAITVNGSSVGSVKSNGSRALFVKKDGVNTGTFDGVNTINLTSSDAWVRPSGWLDLDTVTNGTNKFSGLFAVYETQKNVCTIQISIPSGTRTINWGDGTTQAALNNTVYTKVYDYSTVTSDVLQDEAGFNYKTVVVNFPLNSVTSLFLERNTTATLIPNARSLNWLDIALDCSTITSLYCSSQCYSNKLQRLRVYNVGATIDGAGANFTQLVSLRVLKFPFEKMQSTNQVFTNYCGDFRDENNNAFNLNLTINIGSLFNFFSNGLLSEFGNVTAPLSTSGQGAFANNYNLKKIGTVNLPAVANLVDFISNCVNLESVVTITITSACTNLTNLGIGNKKCRGFIIGSCAGVTSATNAFLFMTSMEILILTGMTRGFTIDDCNMSATAIDALFTSLGTASGAQTINVRRNPGSATCTPSIATAKGFTVVIA